ncbi:uncharacterized protein LOC118735847 [Rhagoletis pomonella]|uniref:uncharacterized protein LOC118735847 n=1 Tax=Rhagoletis pomonella TaxID=28610 RepID=UPI0017833E58|nr:uncharacterized protein LOC118735847 [Rhagoletis pomonella]
MIKTWNVLLLCACLAVQQAIAFPQRQVSTVADTEPTAVAQSVDADTSSSSSSEEKLSLPRNQLLFGTLGLLTNQSRYILRESRNFLKNLLNEMNALPEKSKAIEQNITRVSSVLTDVDSIDLDADPPLAEKMFSGVDEVGKVFDEFYGMPENNDPKSDVAILQKLFEKIGFDDMDKRINVTLQVTLNRFMELFENFETSLGEKEKENDAPLINWYQRFKKEDDIEKKFEVLEEFSTFFK